MTPEGKVPSKRGLCLNTICRQTLPLLGHNMNRLALNVSQAGTALPTAQPPTHRHMC